MSWNSQEGYSETTRSIIIKLHTKDLLQDVLIIKLAIAEY